MMYTGAFICELNPLHNGHEYLLRKMQDSGCIRRIACMSGNFTQRGEPAVFDKFTRTRAALAAGADLVLELPVTYACAGAERFAFGGVYLLQALGIADRLYFGSECGDPALIRRTAAVLGQPEVSELLRCLLSEGITYAAARERAVREISGHEPAAILHQPNDILGTEYCKALMKLQSHIQPFAIQRTAAAHDSTIPTDTFASASYLRRQLYEGKDIDSYIPPSTREIVRSARQQLPAADRQQTIEAAMLYRLRMMSKDSFSALPDISEGLENRLYKAVHTCTSTADILACVKSKRCTMARLRRILMYAFLGITQEDCRSLPQYIRVLGFNRTGQTILRECKKSAALPVVTKAADIASLSEEGRKMFALESRCDDLYALTNHTVSPCGSNYTTKLIVV